MPHARPDEGVNRNALALLVIKSGVAFGSEENDPVNIVLLLAAHDSNQHIEMIMSISEFFCNDDDVQSVIKAMLRTLLTSDSPVATKPLICVHDFFVVQG